MFNRVVLASSAMIFVVFSQFAFAQENLVAKEPPKASDKKALGWTPIANVSVNAAVSSASNVEGKPTEAAKTTASI